MDKIEYRASQMDMSVNEYKTYLSDKDKAKNALAHMAELSKKIKALNGQYMDYLGRLQEAMQNERVRDELCECSDPLS